MKMWAVVENQAPLRCLEVEDPVPTGTEVVVKVSHCGLCHSDLHFWEGQYDFGRGKVFRLSDRGVTLPRAPGHEVVGAVVAFGPDAEGVRIGDRRIVFPWIGCGACPRCQAGQDNLCTRQASVGIVRHGGFAEKVLVPHPKYLVDFGTLDSAFASTLACSGITVYGAIRKLELDDPDTPVLLMGAGGLGHAAIAMLRANGHRNIVVVDIDAAKRAAALAAGALSVVDGLATDVAAEVTKCAGGPIFHAIDFVNNAHTAATAFSCLDKGGKLMLVGISGGDFELALTPFVFGAKSLMSWQTGTVQDLIDVVALAQSAKLNPIPIERRPIEEANAAFEALLDRRVTGRIVLEHRNDAPT